jgi:uncharacterized protein DUF6443
MLKTVIYCLSAAACLLPASGLFAQTPNKPNASLPQPTTTVPVQQNHSTTPSINYVRSWDAKGKHTSPASLIAAGYTDATESTQYIDGLGRPLQQVARQASPQLKDIVAPVVYDGFGREVYKYLPYVQTSGSSNGTFKIDPFTAQKAFYESSTYNPSITGEQYFFSKTEFEASPLNRVNKSMAPGNSWVGSDKGVSVEYLVNTAADGVRIWNTTNNDLTYTNDDLTNIPVSPAAYGIGQLYKTVSKDEENHIVVEYKDKEGQVILKKVQVANISMPADYSGYANFLCTYYVYDDFGRLRFVIQPNAVKAMSTGTWSIDAAMTKDLCFRYEYDSLGRMIAKKVPGAGWVYMVYDQRDRLVFTQDANMRESNRWMATLYDGLNRPVMTGMITYTQNRNQLQTIVDAQSGTGTTGTVDPGGSVNANPVYATREIGHGQYIACESITFLPGFFNEPGDDFVAEIDPNLTGTPQTIEVVDNPLPPNANFIALTVTYYDAYGDWRANKIYTTANNSKLDAGSNLHAEVLPASASAMTKGLVTGTKVRVLENPSDLSQGAWLTTVTYYDDDGRPVQVQSDNYKQGIDVVTTLYDFTGNVLTSYLVHNNPSSTTPVTRVKTNMVYDFGGRLLEVKKTINDLSASTVTITRHEYDELGQLKKKELGRQKGTSGYTSTPIETLNNEYNIRGWLQSINKQYARAEADANWFGMELNYDRGFAHNQLNGNIAGTKWRSKGDGQQRAYGYTYDLANRILVS